jgi:hypothetical protein
MIFVFFCGFYVFTAKGAIYFTDGLVNFETVRSLVEGGSLAINCAIASEYIEVSANGLCYSKYDLGLAVTSIPLYVLSRLFFGPAPLNPEALSPGKLVVSTFNQLVTAATCAVLYLTALRSSGSRRQAIALSFVFGLFTLAWPYSSTYFAQPLVGLLLLVSFLILRTYASGSCPPYAVAGLLLGWASFTRLDAVPLAAMMCIYALSSLVCRRTPLKRTLLLFAFLSFPIVLAIMAYGILSTVRTGNAFQLGYSGEGWTTPMWTGLYGLLFSPGRGIVFYSPLVILAILGLPKLWQRGWRADVGLIGGLAIVQLGIYSSWHAWEGGWSWGPRFLVPTQPLLMLGLLPWLEKKKPEAAVLVLSSVAYLVQMIGALTNTVTYQTRTNYEFSETLFSWAASPLLGHLQDLLQRRVHLLLTTNAHGVATPEATMILGAICLLMMSVSGKLLVDAATKSQGRDGLGQT